MGELNFFFFILLSGVLDGPPAAHGDPAHRQHQVEVSDFPVRHS